MENEKIRYASEEYVDQEVGKISETISEYDFFMKREKYTIDGFEPISYRYAQDGVYGHKYDYFYARWCEFPETIEINTPVLLYDFSNISGIQMWKYSTYESEVRTTDGGYVNFKLFIQAKILGNISNVSMDVIKSLKDKIVEIGTDNFKLEESNQGWILYSIVNLDTLPDEYVGMFPVIGQYYVKTKEGGYLTRLVWEACMDRVAEYAIPTTIARTADVEALSETLAKKEDKIKWYDILNGNSTWAANISGYQQIDFDTGYAVVSPTAPTADPSRTALWGAFGAAETLLNYSMRRFTSPASFTNLLLNFRALSEQSVLSLDEEVHFLSALADPIESPVDRYSHFCLSKVVENEETIWTLQIIKSNWRNICKLVFNETTNTITENTSSPPGYGSVDASLTKADYAADAAAVGTAIGELETSIADKLDAPATAQVGQMIMVSGVDENGVITAVEAVNLVTGDGSSLVETDPTVPSWAKESTKPTYTADEVGAYSKVEIDAIMQSCINDIAALVGGDA